MRRDRNRLAGHLAAQFAARLLFRAALTIAAVAAVWKGPATGLAIVLAALALRYAAPPATEDLDRLTGRK